MSAVQIVATVEVVAAASGGTWAAIRGGAALVPAIVIGIAVSSRLWAIVALTVPWWAPYDPTETVGDRLQRPSSCATGWAPTRSAATCSRARCTAPATRCRSRLP